MANKKSVFKSVRAKIAKFSFAKKTQKSPKESGRHFRFPYGFFTKGWMIFLLGAVIGIALFGLIYGYNLVDFNQTSWMFTSFAHDTGQHQLGWAFFAQGSRGGRVTTLAYPAGIPITFMDSIPLFAFIFKLFGFSATQQYFGLFGLISYALFGGLAALILRWIFAKIKSIAPDFFAKISQTTANQFQLIFVLLGTILLTISPLLIARTFYHTGLTAQWLILLGFLLILYREKIFAAGLCAQSFIKTNTIKQQRVLTKFAIALNNVWRKFCASTRARFVIIWSVVLILVTLIHPYFLPMLGALMIVDFVLLSRDILSKNDRQNLVTVASFRRNFQILKREKTSLVQSIAIYLAQILTALFYLFKFVFLAVLPALVAGLVFAAIGGFSLGGSAGVSDLTSKGFNLLSFVFPGGYSALLPTATSDGARSGSPETMMWLGAGVIVMFLISGILWLLNNQFSRKNRIKNKAHDVKNIAQTIRRFGRARFWLIATVVLALLLFAMSPSIQIGSVELFHYSVPSAILAVWSAFRAAAREAWPFYYLVQFAAIYWFGKQRFIFASNHHFAANKVRVENVLTIIVLVFLAITSLQFYDIYASPNVQNRIQNFAKFANHTADYEFPLRLSGVLTTQKHLVDLDASASGDMSSFNVLGQTAIQNHLTLNVGYFARIPRAVAHEQSAWNQKFSECKIKTADFRDNLFVTRNQTLASKLSNSYEVMLIDGYWFIGAAK